MVEEYQKFRLTDLNGKRDFFVEVNWAPENEDINQCKVLRFTFPKKGSAYIKKEDLLALLWIIGSPKEQRKMIPQKITKVRHYITTLWVQVKKDCKAGDIIKVPVNITLPAVSEEIIAELKKKPPKVEKDVKSSSFLLPSSYDKSKKTKRETGGLQK